MGTENNYFSIKYMNGSLFSKALYMNGSLFSITRYMNGVCFKVSGGTSVPKLPPSSPPPPRALVFFMISRSILSDLSDVVKTIQNNPTILRNIDLRLSQSRF